MRNVLITGALRGIGKSILEVLHSEGYFVYGIYNSTETLVKETHTQFPNTEFIKCNLSSRDEVIKTIQQLKDIKFYAIINNAGIANGESLNDFDINSWDQTLQINLTSPLMIIQGLKNNIVEGGSIVNISSVFGNLVGMAATLSYSASKAALSNLTKSLTLQFKDNNIRANAVAPSIVDTDMTSQDTPEMLNEVRRRTPTGRIARPLEIANIVSFLISDKSSYINGQTIVADGGYSAWDGIY